MNSPITRRSFVKAAGGLLLGSVSHGALGTPGSSQSQRIVVTQFHMNMLVKLTVYVDHPEQGYRLCRRAFEQIHHYVGVFSCFDQRSELRRLCAQAGQGPVRVSDDLLTVLSAVQTLAIQSEGAFDPTAGALTQLWRSARSHGTLPLAQDIKRASQYGGYQHMVLNADDNTVSLLRPNMSLDLGGIAKGYIGDLILRDLRQNGIPCAAYEAGGDIVVGNAPPNSRGWAIEVPGSVHPWFIHNRAVSISGDTHQYLDVQGQRYSHVIDARSGQALVNSKPSVYQASSGLMADAKATLQSINLT